MEEHSIFNKLNLIILIALAFVVPLIFVPAFADFYQFPKLMLIALLAAIAIAFKVCEILVTRKIELKIHPSFLPVLIILIAYLISTFLQDPNYAEAMISRSLLIVSLSVIFFLTSSSIQSNQVRHVLYGLVASCSILAFVTVAHQLGVTEKISQAIWVGNKLWNPTGSPITLLTLLIMGTALSAIFAFKKTTSMLAKSLLIAAAIIQAIALILVAIQLFPGETPTVLNLPQQVGYSIAIDTLKNWRTALFGVGPSNFLAAFTFFKPVAYNADENLWNVRFLTSSNEIFHTMTITGIVGITGLVLLFLYALKCSISSLRSNVELAVVTLIIIVNLIFFPGNAVTLSLLFLFVILFTNLSETQKTITSTSSMSVFGSVALFSIIGIAFIFYGARYTLADMYYYQSLQALSKGQGKAAYDKQLQAIKTNPNKISYQVSYAQTNLLLANALARQENLSDTDKQTILQLIKQSVDASKSAVALNRQNANAWENLAQIYRQLINFADKADEYSMQAYGFQLRLDPRNPRVWVDYGGLLLTIKQPEEAAQAFRQAIALKPDYANAHYNLAYAYKQLQKNDLAVQELKAVLSLIPQDSADFAKAKQEADELAKLVGNTPTSEETSNNQQKNSGENLAGPSPAPEKPDEVAPIDLKDEDAPENLQNEEEGTLPIPSGIPTPMTVQPTSTVSPSPSASPSSTPNN